jgi:hypothetical protein
VSSHLSRFHARGQRNAIHVCNTTAEPINLLAVDIKFLPAQLHLGHGIARVQLLGLRCASVKSPKNARVPLPLLLQLLIAMALLVLQAISTIHMISKFPSTPLHTLPSPPSPPLPPHPSPSHLPRLHPAAEREFKTVNSQPLHCSLMAFYIAQLRFNFECVSVSGAETCQTERGVDRTR